MQFNIVPRTGGLAINRKKRGKRGVRRHNSHRNIPECLESHDGILFIAFEAGHDGVEFVEG